jgi:chromosome segregation ATPase
MPEETPASNPPASRRRNAPEESGGGGKVLAIILGLLVLGLGFALFKSKSGVAAQAEKYTTEIATQKSNVLELTTRLAKETNSAFVAQSNLQAVLDRRTAESASFSNRLVQTRQQLERAEAELFAARNELSAKTTGLGALEVQRDEWQRQAGVIPGLEREIAAQKEKFNRGQIDYVSLQETLGRVSAEKADLERKLQDPLFLRRQALRVEQTAEVRQRAAAKQPINMYDPRVLLDLQPDGTVRPAIATSTPSTTPR